MIAQRYSVPSRVLSEILGCFCFFVNIQWQKHCICNQRYGNIQNKQRSKPLVKTLHPVADFRLIEHA